MKPTKEYFEGFPWGPKGAMRKEIDDWLRKTSGYTSTRAIDKIIKAALQERVITKRLNTRRYHPL